MPECNLLSPSTRIVILNDFKFNVAFLKHVLSIHGQPNRNDFFVVPGDFMLFDWGFSCAPAVLGGSGRGEVPFYEGSAGNEGDVVEINYLD
jgi:hypothetical protein